MKLMVDQSGYGLGNLGDRAMLEVALARCSANKCRVIAHDHVLLREFAGKAELVDMSGLEEWRRTYNIFGGLHRALPKATHQTLRYLEYVLRSKFPYLSYRYIVWRLRAKGPEAASLEVFMSQVLESDALIVTGGGFINDSFPRHAMLVLSLCQLFLNMGKPVGVFGQGIGPLNDPHLKKMLADVAQRATVFGLREGLYGPALLKSLGVSNARVVTTGDDAIELAICEDASVRRTSIGINIRVAPYSGISEDVATLILQSLEKVAKEVDSPLIAVPISWNAGDSDVLSLSSIDSTSSLDKPWSTEQLVDCITDCRVVITASYHAAVFALSQGCPVIAMSGNGYYDAKMRGLADQFNCDESSFRLVAPHELCDTTQMVAIITGLYQKIESVRSTLKQQAFNQSCLSQNLFAEFLAHAQTTVGR